MRKRIYQIIVFASALAVLLAALVAVQVKIDSRSLSSEQSVRELMYFPSSGAVKLISAGNELMMADYLWLRMIQYYAYHMRSDMNYEYLYPITDRLTDLDPKFMYPYTFGSLLLAHDAHDSVNSIALLDKAKRNNPDRWEFPYMKGFILYIFFHRSEEAVREFVEASKLPNAWTGALRFAAWIARKQGHRETSKQMWQDLYDTAKNKQERDVAGYYLDKIAIEEEMDRLQALAEKYRSRQGKWPGTLNDLVAAGLTGQIPRDRFVKQYYWNAVQNRVGNVSYDAFIRNTAKAKN
jgi:hypothetical protein